MSVQLAAVEKTAAFLEKLGANFEIRFGDKVFGGIRHERKQSLDYSEWNIPEQVKACEVGQVLKFSVKSSRPEITLAMLKNNVSSRFIQQFGKQSYVAVAHPSGEYFEIIRVA